MEKSAGQAKPLISVVLLSYNHAQYIKKSVESVFAQLDTWPNLELVIIDDGSNDRSQEILSGLQEIAPIPMRVVFNEHEGISAIAPNLNKLIEMANGKYIAFLASDDEYLPDRFRLQVAILENHDRVKIVYANGFNFEDGVRKKACIKPRSGNVLKTHSPEVLLQHVTREIPMIFIQGVLVEADFIKSYSAFDESCVADDWVFNIRVAQALKAADYGFEFLDQPTFVRNIHAGNTSKNIHHQLIRIIEVINKYCDPRVVRMMKIKQYYKASKLLLKMRDPMFKSILKSLMVTVLRLD